MRCLAISLLELITLDDGDMRFHLWNKRALLGKKERILYPYAYHSWKKNLGGNHKNGFPSWCSLILLVDHFFGEQFFLIRNFFNLFLKFIKRP